MAMIYNMINTESDQGKIRERKNASPLPTVMFQYKQSRTPSLCHQTMKLLRILERLLLVKCSTTLAMKEMQIKIVLRFFLTSARMAKIKPTDDNLCWKE